MGKIDISEKKKIAQPTKKKKISMATRQNDNYDSDDIFKVIRQTDNYDLRQIRKEYDMTQTDMGIILGVNVRTVQRIEKDETKLREEHKEKLNELITSGINTPA